MILTDEEMQQVRRSVEAQAGLDDELVRRCGHLIHLGALDEAVRSAFVLLEERLREAVNEEGMTGTQLANHAFSPTKGPLAKHLGRNQSEREGLRELYSGAFRLFRNPTAHGVIGYSAAEGKAIIGLVDLLLKMLKRAEELPPPGLFPENIERMLGDMEQDIGPGAMSRLRSFLGKCVEKGLKASSSPKYSIPFKWYAFTKLSWWNEPKQHRIPIFYISTGASRHTLHFPVNEYYAYVVGFDVDQLTEELTELGFRPAGKNRNPTIDLRICNDQTFFDTLFDLVVRTADDLEDTLQQDQ
jgi:uncharacterized protein (TIGR02391 family)